MSQLVEVEIGPDGKFRMEFTGFPGEECYAEAERIRAALAGLGIRTGTIEMHAKPGGLIEAEMGIEEETDGEISTRPG